MRIIKSSASINGGVDWDSFGTSLGIVPKQHGPAIWKPYDTYENSFVTNSHFDSEGYYSKDDCQKAIDKYRAYLSRIWGRPFSEDIQGGNNMRIVKSSKSLKDAKKEVDCKDENCDNIETCEDVKASKKLSANDQALTHIKAAIDILGKSGQKDEVTKDSIANLATVMFDIKGSKE